MTDTLYDQIYHKTHPRLFPQSPYERQMELRDLWPADQRKFRELVDAIKREARDGNE